MGAQDNKEDKQYLIDSIEGLRPQLAAGWGSAPPSPMGQETAIGRALPSSGITFGDPQGKLNFTEFDNKDIAYHSNNGVESTI